MEISLIKFIFFKGRSRRLRPNAQFLDDPMGNPYDILKVILGPPYGPLLLHKKP